MHNKENYIMDMFVAPKYQNEGYGSLILAHCIRNMRETKSIQNIRLGVVKTNTGAEGYMKEMGSLKSSPMLSILTDRFRSKE